MALEAGSDSTSIELQSRNEVTNGNGVGTTLAENIAVGSARVEPKDEMLRSTSSSSHKVRASLHPT